MSYTFVPDKASGDFFTEQMWDAHIRDNLNKGVIRPIGDTTVGGTPAEITFSSIAADWAHLFILIYGRGQQASLSVDFSLRFNGDTGTNYDDQVLQGVGTTVSSGDVVTTASPRCGLIPGSTAVANAFGVAFIYLPFYTNSTNYKTGLTWCGAKWGTSAGLMATRNCAFFWRNIAAINSINLRVPAATTTFATGTRATLYGVAG